MRRSIGYAVAAVAAFTLGTPAAARSQAAKPVIAVLYFDNNSFGPSRGDYEGLGKGIADMLITDMASNPNIRVVERSQIQSLLTEQQLTKAGTIDPQTAIKLGKIIGAQYMITGGFMSDSHGTLILTSRAINVETSAITNTVKLTSKGDDVLGLINQLSTQLNTSMKLPALQVGQAGAMAPTPTGAPAAPPPQLHPTVQTATADTSATASSTTAPAQAVASAQSAQPAAAPARSTPSPAARPAAMPKMDLRTALLYSRALEEDDAGNSSKAVELYNQVLSKFPDYAPAKVRVRRLSHG